MADLENCKWLPQKNLIFQLRQFSIFFYMTISWIGPWVNWIDWCKGHWYGSTYMAVRLSDIFSKTGKKCNFGVLGCFWSFVGQPHNYIGWARPMPFASINSTNPRTNPRNFHEKNFENWWSWKMIFFSRPLWISFSRKFFCFVFFQWKNLGFYMRYHFFLHYGWFFQNLGKEAVRTNMHTTVLVWSFYSKLPVE